MMIRDTTPRYIRVPPHTHAVFPRGHARATGTESPGVCADGGVEPLSDGEVWANKFIDVSAPGATCQVRADGADWTIRNVGIAGGVAGPESIDGQHTLDVRVDADASATIDTVYIGDPPDLDTDDGLATGIHVRDTHAGHLDIVRTNVQHTAEGIDASPPGDPTGAGGGGTVTVTDCFVANNASTNVHLGTADARVEGSVVRTDVNAPVLDYAARSRGVWQEYHTGTITGCHLTQAGDDYAIVAGPTTGTVTLRESELRGPTRGQVDRDADTVGDHPLTFLPAGCPANAADAAERLGGPSDEHTGNPMPSDTSGEEIGDVS